MDGLRYLHIGRHIIRALQLRNRPSVRADGAVGDLDLGPARADHRVGGARVRRRGAAGGLQDRGEGRAQADVDGGRTGQVGRPEAQSARPRGK